MCIQNNFMETEVSKGAEKPRHCSKTTHVEARGARTWSFCQTSSLGISCHTMLPWTGIMYHCSQFSKGGKASNMSISLFSKSTFKIEYPLWVLPFELQIHTYPAVTALSTVCLRSCLIQHIPKWSTLDLPTSKLVLFQYSPLYSFSCKSQKPRRYLIALTVYVHLITWTI